MIGFVEVCIGLDLGISEILRIHYKIMHFPETYEKTCDFPRAGFRPALGKSQAFSKNSRKHIMFLEISKISWIPNLKPQPTWLESIDS